jgi:hypothetical protein
MAMAGVDLMTLRELMGHSSITITQRYCHPTPEHKISAMERLEAYNAEKATKKPQKSHNRKRSRSNDDPQSIEGGERGILLEGFP